MLSTGSPKPSTSVVHTAIPRRRYLPHTALARGPAAGPQRLATVFHAGRDIQSIRTLPGKLTPTDM